MALFFIYMKEGDGGVQQDGDPGRCTKKTPGAGVPWDFQLKPNMNASNRCAAKTGNWDGIYHGNGTYHVCYPVSRFTYHLIYQARTMLITMSDKAIRFTASAGIASTHATPAI